MGKLSSICMVCIEDDDKEILQGNVINTFRSLGEHLGALRTMCLGTLAQLWAFASFI